jgi:hypothetical protein
MPLGMQEMVDAVRKRNMVKASINREQSILIVI